MTNTTLLIRRTGTTITNRTSTNASVLLLQHQRTLTSRSIPRNANSMKICQQTLLRISNNNNAAVVTSAFNPSCNQKATNHKFPYECNKKLTPSVFTPAQRWLYSSSAAATAEVEVTEVTDDIFEQQNHLNKNIANNSVTTTDMLLMEAQIDSEYLESLSKQRPTPLRLKDMYDYGKSNRIINAQYLYKELPVRIAQRIIDLLTLPHGLSNAKPIQQVALVYLKFLKRFQDFNLPTNTKDEELFTDMLQSFVLDRSSIPIGIAHGVNEWWKQTKQSENNTNNNNNNEGNDDDDDDRLQEMEEALYRFFTARVGLRFLTEHFVLSSNRDSTKALRKVTCMFPDDMADINKYDNMVGCIQADCKIDVEVQRVVDLVIKQTKEYYGSDELCPKIDIVNCISDEHKDDKFTYVPDHLHYTLAELLKNSCRASVRIYKEKLKKYNKNNTNEPKPTIPDIRVILVKGDEDVTIKVADKGGGIPRSLMTTIWKFAHSTANLDEQNVEFGIDATSGAKIRGFGLPLARIYARYFGGDLTLKSTEGYGVDAYLHLPRLGYACENLPLRVRASPGERVSLPTNNNNNKKFNKNNKKSNNNSNNTKSSSSTNTNNNASASGKRYFSTKETLLPIPVTTKAKQQVIEKEEKMKNKILAAAATVRQEDNNTNQILAL